MEYKHTLSFNSWKHQIGTSFQLDQGYKLLTDPEIGEKFEISELGFSEIIRYMMVTFKIIIYETQNACQTLTENNFNTCTMHLLLFCTMTNKCTINWQIITLLLRFDTIRNTSHGFDVHGSVHRKTYFKVRPIRRNVTLFISVKCSTCFRRFLSPSSGAQTAYTALGTLSNCNMF
jgi:hypothetical protein